MDYLEEALQIHAEPGKYHIRYELVPPNLACLKVADMRVVHGTGKIKNNTLLRIMDESQ